MEREMPPRWEGPLVGALRGPGETMDRVIVGLLILADKELADYLGALDAAVLNEALRRERLPNWARAVIRWRIAQIESEETKELEREAIMAIMAALADRYRWRDCGLNRKGDDK